MAIDTAQRRADATHAAVPIHGPVVIPDGSLTQPDRQSVAFVYSGVAAGEAQATGILLVAEIGDGIFMRLDGPSPLPWTGTYLYKI